MKSIWFFLFYGVVFLLLSHLIWFKSSKKIHLNRLNSKIKLHFQLKIPQSMRVLDSHKWKTAIEKTKRPSICAVGSLRKTQMFEKKKRSHTRTEMFGKWINRISELHFRLSITCFRAHCVSLWWGWWKIYDIFSLARIHFYCRAVAVDAATADTIMYGIYQIVFWLSPGKTFNETKPTHNFHAKTESATKNSNTPWNKLSN